MIEFLKLMGMFVLYWWALIRIQEDNRRISALIDLVRKKDLKLNIMKAHVYQKEGIIISAEWVWLNLEEALALTSSLDERFGQSTEQLGK